MASPGSPTATVVELVWRYGFVLVFATVALVFGIYFGLQIIETQRDGIAAISRMEVKLDQQSATLNEISRRLTLLESKH